MQGWILYLKRDRSTQLAALAVLGVLSLALVIRLVGLGNESAWIDEAYSINLAHHSFAQIIQGTAADQHPPLYYLLLHIWMLIGNSIAHARLLSAFMGVLNVIQLMIFGWKIAGERIGIGGAFLLAISPLHVWYSQEARQYILLTLLTTAASIELWYCLKGHRSWVRYWIFATLAIYTQYFAVFIFLAHGFITMVWSIRQHSWRLMSIWGLSMTGIGIVFAPWIPTAINQFLFHTLSWISEPAAGQVRDVPLALLLGNGVQILPDILRWIGLIGLLILVGWSIFKLRNASLEIRKAYEFFALWVLIPLVAISFLATLYPLFQLKQYLFLVAPLTVFIVIVFSNLPRPWGGIFFAGLALASIMTVSYQQTVNTKDDWRGVALYIENNAQKGDIVYGNPAASRLALDLYWDNPQPFDGYPPGYDILRGGWEGQPLTSEIINQQFDTLSGKFMRVWLVEFFPEFWDPGKIIPAWLASHGNLSDDLYFEKIHLRLYDLIP